MEIIGYIWKGKKKEKGKDWILTLVAVAQFVMF